jgi:uncharacterized protein involved in outer membrane biogenesis
MRLWAKLVIGALVLVIVLVTGSALFISQVDPNDYRDALADVVKDVTGRALRVEGDLRIKLLPKPSLEANDVSFANASWALQPHMARAKRVTAEVALLPLLKGRIVVHRFVAIEPQVFLETNADGRGNWQFGDEAAADAETDDDDGASTAELDLIVREVRIEKAGLAYLDGITKRKTLVNVDQLTIGSKRPGGNLALSLRATYQDLPVTLNGTFGAAGAILSNQPIDVDVAGMVGDAGFTIKGVVGSPLEGKDVRLDLSFKTASTKSLTELAGIELEEFGPVDLTLTLLERNGRYDFDHIKATARPRSTDARVSGSIKHLVIDLDGKKAQGKPAKVDIKGAFGEARFTVTGDVGRPMDGKDLRLRFALKAESTSPLTDIAGIDAEEVGPLDLKVTVIEKDGRFDLDKIDLTARPRRAHVTIKGSVVDVIGSPRPNLHVSLSAKTLHQLDGALPAVGPVSMSANVRPHGKIIEIRNLVAKVGKSDLSGRATLDMGGEQPSASAKLHAKAIDLVELLPATDKDDAAAGVQKTSDGRIFPDDALPLAVLSKANGKIELSVDRLTTPKLVLDKVAITAGLDNGNLTTKLAVRIAGGTVDATIDIDARAQPAKFAVEVDATKVSIGALSKEIRGYETSKGLDSDLKMKLRAQGDTVRTLMAGLDGDIRLEIGEGRLNNDVLDQVGADLLSQIVAVAVPTDEEDEATILNCGVVRFRIEDGDAIADQTIVLETEKVLVKGGGLIDLETESLDLGARLAARKGIRLGAGTLSSLVKVQGTLAEPQLGTDLEGVVKTGAKVGIAVVTVGLSLVAESVYGHITEDDYPCQTALARQIEVTSSDYRAQRVSEEN